MFMADAARQAQCSERLLHVALQAVELGEQAAGERQQRLIHGKFS